jgi:hypothetical protein
MDSTTNTTSEWWYCSSPRFSFAVELKDGKVSEGAPIALRFRGQSAKKLGAWLRSHGEVRFERLASPWSHVYCWGNNSKRATMKGQRCKIVVRGTAMRSVLIELENGQREVVSYRALKKV